MRARPSAEVNSVMISPQPDCWLLIAASTSAESDSRLKRLALRMKRRKTVSVTPAMGARTVAGATSTPPMDTEAGTRAAVGIACSIGLSQFFFIASPFLRKSPRAGGGFRNFPWLAILLRGWLRFGVFAAEALDPARR